MCIRDRCGGVPTLLRSRWVRPRTSRIRCHARLKPGTLAGSLHRVGRPHARLRHLLPGVNTRLPHLLSRLRTRLLSRLRARTIGTGMTLALPPTRPTWLRTIGLIRAGPALGAGETPGPRRVGLIRIWRRRCRTDYRLRRIDGIVSVVRSAIRRIADRVVPCRDRIHPSWRSPQFVTGDLNSSIPSSQYKVSAKV